MAKKVKEIPSVKTGRLPNEIFKEGVELGRRVRHVRKDLYDETQVDFAARIGTTVETLKQIERGRQYPNIPTIIRIIKKCKISYSYLLEGK